MILQINSITILYLIINKYITPLNAHLKTNTEFSTKKLNIEHLIGGSTL